MHQYDSEIQYISNSSNDYEIGTFENENSENLNYDEAFEEMKMNIHDQDYTNDRHNLNMYRKDQKDNYERMYDNYLDREIETPTSGISRQQFRQKAIDQNRDNYMLKATDLSDQEIEMPNEFEKDEKVNKPVIVSESRKEDFVLNAEEGISPFKLMNAVGNSANTIEKAMTYHRSVGSSESISRSPKIFLHSNSNIAGNVKGTVSNTLELTRNYITNQPLKTYVLNKSRKLIDNLNRSEKD